MSYNFKDQVNYHVDEPIVTNYLADHDLVFNRPGHIRRSHSVVRCATPPPIIEKLVERCPTPEPEVIERVKLN